MLCKKCGKEYIEGTSVCPSCNSTLEHGNKEKQVKQSIFPIAAGMGFWAAATAYGIPKVAASTGKKDSGVSAVAAASAVVSAIGNTAYGIPSISSRVAEERGCNIVKDEKLCDYCKSEVKLDDKVCPKCGKKLGFAALFKFENE